MRELFILSLLFYVLFTLDECPYLKLSNVGIKSSKSNSYLNANVMLNH